MGSELAKMDRTGLKSNLLHSLGMMANERE